MGQDEANLVGGDLPRRPQQDAFAPTGAPRGAARGAQERRLSGDPFLSALLIVFPVAMCGLVLATWFLFGRQRISGWYALAAIAAIAGLYYWRFGVGRRGRA
jgi:hypothetical protein